MLNLLETWFFDQLRTQEQLGYVAYVGTGPCGQADWFAIHCAE
jgi:secreted Zn-dependent insulinase-like peptidase